MASATSLVIRLGGILFTSSQVWAVIRRFPESMPFKFITRIIWTPTMMLSSFNCDPIDDYVILGSIPRDEDDFIHIKKLYGVNNIMTMNEDWELAAVGGQSGIGVGIDRVQLATPDFNPPSLDVIKRAVDILHADLGSKNIYYIHCKAGKGRSAVIVVCYVMYRYYMNVDEAIKFVKRHRPSVSLNEQQIDAIQQYYCKVITELGKENT